MIELMLFVAIVGSTVAGLWDLFTTEVPDEIPSLMISMGILYWFIDAVSKSDFLPFFISVFVGTVVLIFGIIMYRTKQWGGADALMLSAIGFVLPVYMGKIFMIDYIINFFIVGAAYTILYAIIIGLMNRWIFREFIKDLKGKGRIVVVIPAIFSVFICIMSIYGFNTMPLLYVLVLIILVTLFWRYGIVIENKLFRKRVLTKNLKVGDVIDDMQWVGLTAEQIKIVQKQKKYATVKEGVRFVPVFPITLIITLFFGNIIFTFI